MARTAVIKEVKVTTTGERQEFVCRLLDRSAAHAVVLYKIKEARRVGSLRLPRGALTYGYFWEGRPYNVYHWVRADGRTLGFYVNLANEVRFRPGAIEWKDLALDLLFSPDGGHVQILDEEDFVLLPPEVRAKAEAAKAHVLTHRDEILAEVAAVTAHLRGRHRVVPHERNRGVKREAP
ncbi:MAG: DUF402 domain-containing protein [Bacillati bacterium ANGP1]|uniref:DUF402 domain-containing protein n=1 Tax=Candidatus Segetimicrobium genomatis TaxID=2569760 RepID=A0A537LAK7_9BACT|nr:MAG: DUF402 domain-containing protein [Terrabacteria group bacterium ANGP1]